MQLLVFGSLWQYKEAFGLGRFMAAKIDDGQLQIPLDIFNVI